MILPGGELGAQGGFAYLQVWADRSVQRRPSGANADAISGRHASLCAAIEPPTDEASALEQQTQTIGPTGKGDWSRSAVRVGTLRSLAAHSFDGGKDVRLGHTER